MTVNIEQSSLLNKIPGIKHGFFTKEGGFSAGNFSSLNFGYLVGDDLNIVNKNRQLAFARIGFQNQQIFMPKLSHSSTAIFIDNNSTKEQVATIAADAMICLEKNKVLGVTYADCLPILLASTDASIIGAIHAGWRGLVLGVIKETILLLQKFISKQQVIYAAIGPCISQHGFRVDKDVLDTFLRLWPLAVRKEKDHGFVDLEYIARCQLENAGIFTLEKVGGNTDLETNKYYSNRLSVGHTGRHLAIILINK